jgi:hypothetical protein
LRRGIEFFGFLILGAIAFGTVLAMRGVMNLWARFRSRG